MARPSVFTLQSSEINENWWWIGGFLAEVKEPGWTAMDVRRALVRQQAQLWGVSDGEKPVGVWITKVERSNETPWGLVWIAAGEGLEQGLKLFREHTEPWFREKGCKYIQIFGRKGWKKVLPDYEDRGVILTKELT